MARSKTGVSADAPLHLLLDDSAHPFDLLDSVISKMRRLEPEVNALHDLLRAKGVNANKLHLSTLLDGFSWDGAKPAEVVKHIGLSIEHKDFGRLQDYLDFVAKGKYDAGYTQKYLFSSSKMPKLLAQENFSRHLVSMDVGPMGEKAFHDFTQRIQSHYPKCKIFLDSSNKVQKLFFDAGGVGHELEAAAGMSKWGKLAIGAGVVLAGYALLRTLWPKAKQQEKTLEFSAEPQTSVGAVALPAQDRQWAQDVRAQGADSQRAI